MVALNCRVFGREEDPDEYLKRVVEEQSVYREPLVPGGVRNGGLFFDRSIFILLGNMIRLRR